MACGGNNICDPSVSPPDTGRMVVFCSVLYRMEYRGLSTGHRVSWGLSKLSESSPATSLYELDCHLIRFTCEDDDVYLTDEGERKIFLSI